MHDFMLYVISDSQMSKKKFFKKSQKTLDFLLESSIIVLSRDEVNATKKER